MIGIVSFLLLALLLGFKHSYDADHVIAVSAILRKVKSFGSALKIGISWAIGHMITAAIITAMLFYFRESFLSGLLSHFEKIVGVMLIALGLWSLKDAIFFHSHSHRHGNTAHSHVHSHFHKSKHSHLHKHMLGIGIVHGLASNDELLVLLTASLGVATFGGIMLGIGFFSIGVVLGMAVFSAFFAFPLVKLHSDRVYRLFSFATGAISVAYGALSLVSAA